MDKKLEIPFSANTELSLGELRPLISMCAMVDGNRKVSISISKLSKSLGIKRRNLQNYLKSIREKGFLEVTNTVTDNGAILPNTYRVIYK